MRNRETKVIKEYVGTFPIGQVSEFTKCKTKEDYVLLRIILLNAGFIVKNDDHTIINSVELRETSSEGLVNMYIFWEVYPVTTNVYIGQFPNEEIAKYIMATINDKYNAVYYDMYISKGVLNSTTVWSLNGYMDSWPTGAKKPERVIDEYTVTKTDKGLKVAKPCGVGTIVVCRHNAEQKNRVLSALLGMDRDND